MILQWFAIYWSFYRYPHLSAYLQLPSLRWEARRIVLANVSFQLRFLLQNSMNDSTLKCPRCLWIDECCREISCFQGTFSCGNQWTTVFLSRVILVLHKILVQHPCSLSKEKYCLVWAFSALNRRLGCCLSMAHRVEQLCWSHWVIAWREVASGWLFSQ